MKKYLALLALLVCIQSARAQTQSRILLTPGSGAGALKLGMSEKQAMALLKGEASWYSYAEEMSQFKGEPVAIENVSQFVIGFDSAARYQADLPESLPVFSLYFKNHKLNYITITSYGASEVSIRQIELVKGIRLHDSERSCKAKLGNRYINVAWGEYTEHLYPEKGLEMTYSEGKLVTIGIFPVTKNYRQLQAKKSAALKEQMQQLEGGEAGEMN